MKRHKKTDHAKRNGGKRSKLKLKRETVRNLSSDQLAEVAGGRFSANSCDVRTHC